MFASFNIAFKPFLSRVLIARAVILSVTKRFSSGNHTLLVCKLGRNLLRVLLLACETLLPAIGPFPVNSHLLAIVDVPFNKITKLVKKN